jgi:arachidonate 15-lipoxygenase
VWHAIGEFVRSYVALYYASDAEVAEDPEVAKWGAELAAPAGAGLRGVDPRIATREALAVMLQRIIWSCGPLHCAVNYPQWEAMAEVPNMPAALYDTPWEGSEPVDDDALVAMLPPEPQVALQVFTVRELTCFRWGRLGDYDPGDLDDPAALQLVDDFRARLRHIAARQVEADAKRPWPYPYLNPDNILNATNI